MAGSETLESCTRDARFPVKSGHTRRAFRTAKCQKRALLRGDVRFGSLADIRMWIRHVGFTLKSRHTQSRIDVR